MSRTKRTATLVLVLAAMVPVAARAVVSNCAEPVENFTSCSYLPQDCWIEQESSHHPWLARPKNADWKKNPARSRAFCSVANATAESSGQWYSYSIYLPEGYDLSENAGVRYPVVYWLHGRLYDPDDFSGRGSATAMRVHKRILQRRILPTIYVTPYGGFSAEEGEYSWIDQWTDGGVEVDRPGCDPDDPGTCFRADSALDELIEHVDSNYRTLSRAGARGVEGFSRGGAFALQRTFRQVDGNYRFGSLVAGSPAANWEEGRFSPNAKILVTEYAGEYPDESSRPIQIMLKHGDLEADQSAIPTRQFSDFLQAEEVGHSIEQVVPTCGEERGFPCESGETPPPLGHEQPRMDRLRGDLFVRFHDGNFRAALTPVELDALQSHRLPCADKLGWATDAPPVRGAHDGYFPGDFDGDGCDSMAIRHRGSVYVDDGLDGKFDDKVKFGPDDARYFAIDWRDEGEDWLGYADYSTADCPGSWEVRLYADDLGNNGHGPEDEPFFCFEGAPQDTDILVGDFDGDWKDDIAYRDENDLFWTSYLASGYTGEVTGSTRFGTKHLEDQHGSGRWAFGQPADTFLVRRGNLLLLQGHDEGPNVSFNYGGGGNEDQYLFGDWDGDGRTNVAVRRCNLMLLDVTFDAAHDYQFYYGWGTGGCHCDDSC